jgi:hypothetical protein
LQNNKQSAASSLSAFTSSKESLIIRSMVWDTEMEELSEKSAKKKSYHVSRSVSSISYTVFSYVVLTIYDGFSIPKFPVSCRK